MSPTLRYRGDKRNLIELAKSLDAFKKVPEKYRETTEIGGTLSLFSRILILFLIYKEISYYREAMLVFQFEPDINMDDRVQMHIDITVAMPCLSLANVDVYDRTPADIFAHEGLQRDDTWWTMTDQQRMHFEQMQHMNNFLREEYHSVADVLFRNLISSQEVYHPPVSIENASTSQKFDACRLHGTVPINKVAGMLQLVGSRRPTLRKEKDTWFITLSRPTMNFTHRIHRLSFGHYSRNLIQPLEGDEVIITDADTTVHYFLKIVPTEIHKTFSTINMYQYAVTERIRKLEPKNNSYGVPGIHMKYDWSALRIIVSTGREHIAKFVLRLCSIISGIIVISGILNSVLTISHRRMIGFLAPEILEQRLNNDMKTVTVTVASSSSSPPTPVTVTTPTPTPQSASSNNLISNANEMINDNLLSTQPTTTLLPISGTQTIV